MAPKSILKKTTNTLGPLVPPAGSTKEERNREIAIYHANLIQAQKEVENEILEALEALVDFPTDRAASSSNPSPSDVEAFKKYVSPFQPSDYDDLLGERRIAGKCGHVFCSRAPKKKLGGGKFKIVGKKKGQDFKVVEREKMDCWCSTECARRALYVKVQLDEEPAWTRRGGSAPEIQIMVGEEAEDEDETAVIEKRKQEDLAKLAIERGDQEKPERSEGMVKEVMEKEKVSVPEVPSRHDTVDAIEGYAPKGVQPAVKTKDPSVKYELGDRDWDL